MLTELRRARTRRARARVLVLAALLAGTAATYVLLPPSWFRVGPGPLQSPPARRAGSLQELERAATAAPTDPIARSRYGFALAQANREAEAERELQTAVHLAPENPTLWYNLGVLYLNSDHAADAERAFRRMEELVPGDAQVHFELGLALEAQGRLPDARTHLQLASDIDPGAAEPRLWMAILDAYNKTPEQLQAELVPYIQKIPQPGIAYYLLARSYMRHERWDQAASYAHLAIQTRPEDFAYWHCLGQICLRAHRLAEARIALNKALSLYGRSSVAQAELGIVDMTEGRTKEAAEHFEVAIRANPGDKVTRRHAVDAYRKLGNTAKQREHEAALRALELKDYRLGVPSHQNRAVL